LQDISFQSVIDCAGESYSLYGIDIGSLFYWGYHEVCSLKNIDIIMIV
jgi:hypothetical protein